MEFLLQKMQGWFNKKIIVPRKLFQVPVGPKY
jgi:hypothetical protein